MNLKEIESSVRGYIKESQPEYSLMITGEWGSGKTYFWDNVIRAGIERDYPDGQRNSAYVSLYGTQARKEIDGLITQATAKFLRQKSTGLVSSKLSSLSQRCLDIDNACEILRTSNVVLCIDDLERVKMPIEAVLGYLNKLVEHEHLRMIILCDENKIKDKKIYALQKEKLVGYTFKYTPDIDSVVEKLITEISKKHSTDNLKNVFSQFYSTSKCNNIRTIRKALKIYTSVGEHISAEDATLLDTIFYFILVIMNDYKTGTYDDMALSELDNYLKNSSSNYYLIKDNKKSPIKHVVTKYYHGNHRDFPRFSSIYNYIVNGYLNSELLRENIDKHLESKQVKPKPRQELFFNEFWHLSEEEINRIASNLLEDVANATVTNATALVTLAQRLFFFAKEGIITHTPDYVRDKFLQGLKNLKTSGELEFNNTLWTTLSFNDVNIEGYKMVKSAIKSLCDEMQAINQSKTISNTFLLLNDSPDEFFQRFYEAPHSTTPVLADIDADWLSDLIIKCTPDTVLKFSDWLESRYVASNIKDYLQKEEPTLNALLKRVTTNLSEPISGIKAYCLKGLRKSLTLAINKLS